MSDSSPAINEAREVVGDLRGSTAGLTEAVSRDAPCCVKGDSCAETFGVATRTVALVHILVLAS